MKIKPVHYRYLVRVFELSGWRHTGTKGDHLIYKKPGAIRAVVIPKYKTVPVFIIKNNLRTAGISRDEYLRLLKS
jgi:predicted RNA binding protein YcfA (HicA-like mRNA interferase family)